MQPNTLTPQSLPELFTTDGHLSLQSLEFHFDSIVYLKVTPLSVLCSCPAAAMHAQCEHATFVCSLKFPNCPKPSVILEAWPCARKRNGRPTTSAAPPRKRRRAAKWSHCCPMRARSKFRFLFHPSAFRFLHCSVIDVNATQCLIQLSLSFWLSSLSLPGFSAPALASAFGLAMFPYCPCVSNFSVTRPCAIFPPFVPCQVTIDIVGAGCDASTRTIFSSLRSIRLAVAEKLSTTFHRGKLRGAHMQSAHTAFAVTGVLFIGGTNAKNLSGTPSQKTLQKTTVAENPCYRRKKPEAPWDSP